MSTPRSIPDPGFADDDGSGDPAVATALTAYAAGEIDHADALDVVRRSRLVVPVVAVLGEVEHGHDGLAREKSSDMAAVLLARPDGRRGMLAFTSTDSLRAWNPEARPVPVTAATAARAAQQEEADALVVDVAGPVRFVIGRHDLAGVAGEWALTRVGGRSAWIRPAAE
ncbi:SseB family protein [Nocardioides coralli]|uniref:SseB family protein n=1 Tax=Nocardioides coralli TaxID=2872154 RepID=UPI001CA469C3|nr:SseB family protein [Nocardioides coralli]QZY30546.1 SseB family protein [Nocardioides coralli]